MFVRPGVKSWAALAGRPDAFFRGSEAFYGFRFAFFRSQARGQKSGTRRIVLFRCNLESEGYNDCFEYPNASINQEAPSVFHMGYI